MTIGIFKEWLVKYFFVHKIFFLKPFLYFNTLSIIWQLLLSVMRALGANRLTFQGETTRSETTRGEQVSGAKRPGANRSSGRNDPDSIQRMSYFFVNHLLEGSCIKVNQREIYFYKRCFTFKWCWCFYWNCVLYMLFLIYKLNVCIVYVWYQIYELNCLN
jgi:hypothetical protein